MVVVLKNNIRIRLEIVNPNLIHANRRWFFGRMWKAGQDENE